MAQESDPPPLTRTTLKLWFSKVRTELRIIEASIGAKTGGFIFKVHRYTKEELLALPEFQKVGSLCGQIDSLVSGWQSNNSVDEEGLRIYHENRLEIEDFIGELKARIIQRNPTFAESIKHFAVVFLSSVLPMLPASILGMLFGPEYVRLLTHVSNAITVNDDDV